MSDSPAVDFIRASIAALFVVVLALVAFCVVAFLAVLPFIILMAAYRFIFG